MRVVTVSVMLLLIGVLAVSLISKVRSRASLRAFADALADMRVVPRRWAGPAAAVSVAAEIVVLALLLWPRTLVIALAAATALFVVFTAVLVTAVRRGSPTGCHCFGATSGPVGWRHVARTGFLCATSVVALCCAVALGPAPLSGMAAPQVLVAAAVAGVAVPVLVWLDDLVWLFRGMTTAP